jgi:AraC-like DNA-binding protein
MDPLLRVVVTRPKALGKQVEVIHVQQKESFFNLVTESNSVFFAPNFVGRVRCGSKFIESNGVEPVAAYLGKGFPLVIDAQEMQPWWIVHIHDDISQAENVHPIKSQELIPTTETMSFYKVHSGEDFLIANVMNQVVSGALPEALLESFLRELPSQLEPCANLPASGNRRLAEKLRLKIIETEDKQINLKEIADELGCHPSQLSREFRRLFGMAPYKFSFLLRLAKTKEWLRRGQNLADVALNFEFSDQSHFTRAFRQVYQMTPNHYRNLYKEAHILPVEPNQKSAL